jgi:holliday junction DNA helicase RuvA
MYEYIKGKLAYIDSQKAIVDINGVGYKLNVITSLYLDLQLESQVFFYISYIVKEDSHNLYGFIKEIQRNIFEMLNTISGIGAKTALLLLSHLDIENLYLAVKNADIKLISKVPGIGKKTAERLVLELKDKLKTLDQKYLNISSDSKSGSVSDAIGALMNLGYSFSQAQKAVKGVLEKDSKTPEISELITKALKNI